MAFTLDLLEGFDCYGGSDTDIGYRWPEFDIGLDVDAATHRGSSGYSLEMNDQTAAAANVCYMPLGDAYRCVVVGFAMYYRATTKAYSAHRSPLQLEASFNPDINTRQLTLVMNTSSKLELRRGDYDGTLLATSTTEFKGRRWYYIELKVYVDNTSGAYELKVDGSTDFSGTSVDTQNRTDDNFIGNLRWQSMVTGTFGPDMTWFLDDIYVQGDSANTAGGFLGDIRVESVLPNGDGNYSQWARSTGTTDYTLIDETVLNTGDYLSESTAADKFTVTHVDVSQPGDIVGVDQMDFQSTTNGPQRSMKALYRRSSTDYAQTAKRALHARYWHHVYPVDPATSSAWTSTNLNNGEFGIELV